MKTTLLILLAAVLTGCIPFIDHNGPRRKWYYLGNNEWMKDEARAMAAIPAPTPGRFVPFEYPSGLFLSDYVWQLEATTNFQHWTSIPYSVDAEGTITVQATQSFMFYRTCGIPRS